jgi:hypothetical protein
MADQAGKLAINTGKSTIATLAGMDADSPATSSAAAFYFLLSQPFLSADLLYLLKIFNKAFPVAGLVAPVQAPQSLARKTIALVAVLNSAIPNQAQAAVPFEIGALLAPWPASWAVACSFLSSNAFGEIP